ncbi:hypothetical protein Nepgr_026658 [Nepenthes gracilis]|uniref:Uncharacterized protein n=1 Tax=Nepenthes gracilis TaxID=150966 RepID=A0AAD3T7A2_NEPGR|nr:hypothetical protein Nepgr_026658 [Nepenthes gracilis]
MFGCGFHINASWNFVLLLVGMRFGHVLLGALRKQYLLPIFSCEDRVGILLLLLPLYRCLKCNPLADVGWVVVPFGRYERRARPS